MIRGYLEPNTPRAALYHALVLLLMVLGVVAWARWPG